MVGYVSERRRYDILAARPLAKIYEPTAIAAKGEVLVGVFNRFLAHRALYPHLALGTHSSIVDGNAFAMRVCRRVKKKTVPEFCSATAAGSVLNNDLAAGPFRASSGCGFR